jgi:elongation factor G
VEKGFRRALAKGPLAEYPILGIHAILEDGSYHEEDSSDLAFQTAAYHCLRTTFLKMHPVLLEPVMTMEVECPGPFQGPVAGDLNGRRGLIRSATAQGKLARIVAEVPLAETFGYSTDLRSMTQGQGTFTMELAGYRRVPAAIQHKILGAKKAELVGAG